GDQPAPRRELGLQPVAVGAVDQGGVGQARAQRRRRLDQLGERRGALGPGRRLGVAPAPERRRLAVQRRVQVVAEGGGQRLLVALVRRDGVQRRGEAAALGLRRQRRQRAGLGGQPAQLVVQLALGFALGLQAGLRGRARLLGRLQSRAGGGQ